MVLIALSLIYILFTTLNLGLSFNRILNIDSKNISLISINGLFFSTIIGSIWAIFGRINIEFHLFLFFFNFILFYINKSLIVDVYKLFIFNINQLTLKLKLFLAIQTFLILAQCSAPPYLVDNESYYIQTIKWLNEFGFVNGVANLHVFFGQTSGWHIAQSVFNFSFLYPKFNDLSGFILLLATFFSIFKLNEYFKNKNILYLIIGLFPLANIFFFQFISSPSPDVAIYALSFFVFYYFSKNYNQTTANKLNVILVLCLFMIYIKTTAIGIMVLPIALLLKDFKLIKNLNREVILTGLILMLFFAKNCIITGYPLFPKTVFDFNFHHKIDKNLVQFYFSKSRFFEFFITSKEYIKYTDFQIVAKWFLQNKIDGIINTISVLIMFFTPLIIYKFNNKKAFWVIYFSFLFQMILLLFSSPQYRFFIHYPLFFCFMLFTVFCTNKNLIKFLLFTGTILTAIVLFFTINLSSINENKLTSRNSTYKLKNTVFPHYNSKNYNQYLKITKGNLNFYSLPDNSFFWNTGNSNLPCTSNQLINFNEAKFGVIPQQNSSNLKDGFYSKKIKK